MMGPVWSLRGGDAATQAVTWVTVPHCAGVSSPTHHLRLQYTHRGGKGSDVTFQAAIYPGSQVLLGVLIGLILIF